MAKKQSVFIIRDENISSESYEEMQSTWLEENHPDKTLIAGEDSNVLIINEEDSAIMCMEYK